MNALKRALSYFSRFELILWSSSVILIILSYLIFKNGGYLTLIASLVGATSLIFCAKGNPIGQVLMIIFGILYGIISLSFSYYGEMITYLGMSVPMAVVALVSWLRNPYGQGRAEVKVNSIGKKELVLLTGLTAVVTVVFYYILLRLGTSNILPSTVSVATSFFAVYLTARRSPYFALAYAANDVVLIVLWILASFHDISYLSVIVCFVMFLFNDLYSFFNWRRMQKKQAQNR